jgi:hypothetical protein
MEKLRLCSCGNPPSIVSNGSLDVVLQPHVIVRCFVCGWFLMKEFRDSEAAAYFWNRLDISVENYNKAAQITEGW